MKEESEDCKEPSSIMASSPSPSDNYELLFLIAKVKFKSYLYWNYEWMLNTETLDYLPSQIILYLIYVWLWGIILKWMLSIF